MFPETRSSPGPQMARKLVYGVHNATMVLGSVVTIPHGLGEVPGFAEVTPGNALIAVPFWTSWDATNITVTLLAPLAGTIKINWWATV